MYKDKNLEDRKIYQESRDIYVPFNSIYTMNINLEMHGHLSDLLTVSCESPLCPQQLQHNYRPFIVLSGAQQFCAWCFKCTASSLTPNALLSNRLQPRSSLFSLKMQCRLIAHLLSDQKKMTIFCLNYFYSLCIYVTIIFNNLRISVLLML